MSRYFWHRRDCWHVRLRTQTRYLVLNLQVVETFALVQCNFVRNAASLFVGKYFVICTRRTYLLRASVTAVVLIGGVAVGIVDKALFLEKIFATSLASFIELLAATEGVILYVNLTLGGRLLELIFGFLTSVDILLQHANQTDQLASLYLLWIEIVGFSYV